MKVLRTAIIGLGRVGWGFHVPEVVRHGGFELVAVVDPLQDRLDQAKTEFGVKGYPDHESMLAAERPGLVVIASPTPFHAEQAVAAFEAGADVFCDKPLAGSLAETDRIIASMEAHGRKLMAYQPRRAEPLCLALRDILRQGLIGPVYMMKCANSRWRRRLDWQALKKYGGGMLYNYGAHTIDVLLHVAGSRAKRVHCVLRTVASLGDADDVVKAVIETEDGTILDVDINQAAAWPMPDWQVMGKRGGAIYDRQRKAWHVKYFVEKELPAVSLQQGLAAEGRVYRVGEVVPWRERTFDLSEYRQIDFYRKCYDHFALGAEPFVPVSETRELMRVLEECRASAAGAGRCR